MFKKIKTDWFCDIRDKVIKGKLNKRLFLLKRDNWGYYNDSVDGQEWIENLKEAIDEPEDVELSVTVFYSAKDVETYINKYFKDIKDELQIKEFIYNR